MTIGEINKNRSAVYSKKKKDRLDKGMTALELMWGNKLIKGNSMISNKYKYVQVDISDEEMDKIQALKIATCGTDMWGKRQAFIEVDEYNDSPEKIKTIDKIIKRKNKKVCKKIHLIQFYVL